MLPPLRHLLGKTLPIALLLGLLGSLFGATAGCGQRLGWSTVEGTIRSQYPDVRQLATDSLAAWLDRPGRPRPVLLDVRQEAEYAVSHLRGAVRVDPDAEDLSSLADVPKGAPVVAYCSVGYRSSALAERLMEAGYTDVWNLEGSIFRWANEGRPVYRDGRPVEAVHPYDRLWGTLLVERLRAYEPD